MIRLGVIGTGRIAARFMRDLELVPQAQAVCVYNPHIESARKFAQKYQISQASNDWDQFLECVDAVYIASPHQTHVDYAKKALSSGRHVLCEKPMAFSKQAAEELYETAKEKHLVLTEAVKTAYCPGFQQLLRTVQSGIIGEVRDVEACFTKLEDPNGRERTDPVYGGSMVELGTYVMLPIIKIFGTNPKSMQFQSVWDEKGVDLFTKMIASYEQGFALGKTGVGVKSEGDLVISGTKGYIYAKSPWWLTKEFEVRYEDPDKKEVYTFPYERNGLHYELQAFVNEIQSTNREYDEKKKLSTAMADVMDQYLDFKRSREKSG